MRDFMIVILLIMSSFCLKGQESRPTVPGEEKLLRPDNPATLKGTIRFPNAFRWNQAGPTGGYWTENQVDDYTFRPVYTNVASYRLQIYNRRGLMIYESSEIGKGWDGYLANGLLATQGVYIWKVAGKFSDGSEFSKAGDVTFLY